MASKDQMMSDEMAARQLRATVEQMKKMHSENTWLKDRYEENQRRDDYHLEGYGNDWGDKVSFTVGVTFFYAAALGGVVGIRKAMRDLQSRKYLPKKMRMYQFVNTWGKEIVRFGNASAAASLLFCFSNTTINFLFEEELQDADPFWKNVCNGAATGVLYKCSRGIRPAFVGGTLGALLLGSIHLSVDKLNSLGYINFGMVKF
mmetsp:Transcript_24376/g.27671  ORF Transcript_24376/g.27671 Transcript_24376/m.27671 type:complete len:203 (+) Transcript_24376:47-655(+)